MSSLFIGDTGLKMGYTGSSCCGYGKSGGVSTKTGTKGFDCVQIPGASKVKGTGLQVPRFCGRSAGLVTATASASPQTVCCKLHEMNSGSYEIVRDLASVQT